MPNLIYLDNNATTQIDPEVLEKMLPFLSDIYGNPASTQYTLGRKANHALEHARNTIADIISCEPSEITFNSGASESISTVLKGVFENYASQGNHIITTQTEHKATLSTLHHLEKKGANVTYLPVDSDGCIDLQLLENSIGPKTILVTIIAANNETGVLNPIEDIAEICNKHNVLYFCDATQWIGKKDLSLKHIPIDILCFSSHKHHGPKGVGVLFKRNKRKPIQIPALIIGGQQENSSRGGTHNLAAIVGMAEALKIATSSRDNWLKIENIRNSFEKQIINKIPHVKIQSFNVDRINNTSNITFKYARASEIIINCPTLAMSTGSACVTGMRDPSHVLKAMGIPDEDCFSTLRFSFNKWNTLTEIDQASTILQKAILNFRAESPIWPLYLDGIID